MTPDAVKALVARELAAWQAPVTQPGSTHGVAWTAEEYRGPLDRLRAALVAPYEHRFVLRETDDPERRRVSGEAVYWVVAQTGEMFLWYDEATNEFGVGEPSGEGVTPVSIGLRGDMVGAFCAW